MSNVEKSKNTQKIKCEDLKVYMNDLKRYKPIPRDEERELIRQYKYNNDLVARQKLITSNLRYAFSLVNKYKNMGVPLSDLLEEANCGLIESIDKFDAERDVKIITYAKWNMEWHMQNAIEKHNKLQQSDLPEEKSEQFSDEALLSGEFTNTDYINEAFLEEEIEDRQASAVSNLESIIQVLDERETDFIKMYYGINPYEGKEYTYQEIGNKYGITKERVRQIIDKIMRKLRVQALLILKQ